MNRNELEQLSSNLETDQKIVSEILGIVGSENWNHDCQKMWESPTNDNIIYIKSQLEPGDYCWGWENFTV